MHILVNIFLHLFLINSIVFVQSQSPAWAGNYSIVTTGSNPVCNQTACCCFINSIVLSVASPSVQLTSTTQGAACNMNTSNNALSASFSIPPGLVATLTNLGFTTDSYNLILSSDSNTLTVNDTTNQQCSSVAQRIGTATSSTTVITTVTNVNSTTPTMLMNTTTNSNGRNGPGFSIAYCLFLSIFLLILT